MINKIIDDVDVSGCEHFCRADCCSAFYLENADDYCPCEGQECNYKRLIRLKQENEELKKEINLYKNSIVANHDRAIGKRFEEVLEENEELKQALEEIREIIRFPLYTNSTKPLSQIDFLINLVNEFEKNREKIINKINEVLK